MAGAKKLDRRIVIERYTSSMNGFNEPQLSWSTFATVWANYSALSDGEKISSGQVNSALSARFLVRSSSETKTVNTKDRLSFESGTWEITGVKESAEGRNRYIEIIATRQSD